jgi:hypothetical protein
MIYNMENVYFLNFFLKFLNFELANLELIFFLNFLFFMFHIFSTDLSITLFLSLFAVVGRVVRCDFLMEGDGFGNHDGG